MISIEGHPESSRNKENKCKRNANQYKSLSAEFQVMNHQSQKNGHVGRASLAQWNTILTLPKLLLGVCGVFEFVLTGVPTMLGDAPSSGSSTLCCAAAHLHSLPSKGTAALDLPLAVSNGVQGQTCGDLVQQRWTEWIAEK